MRDHLCKAALMRLQILIGLVYLLISPVSFGVSTRPLEQPQSARAKYNFNSGWRLLVGDPDGAKEPGFDDSGWQEATLPHAWNEDSAFKVSIHDLPAGIAWYRKRFRLPAGGDNQKVFLEFEGIRQGGEFWLNGKFIGRHENGVMAFGFDITNQLHPAPQENVLAARIDNSWTYREHDTNSAYQWNDQNFYANYGGINKNVYLHVTDKLYQTLPLYSTLGTVGPYVHAHGFDIAARRATVVAETQVRNEYPTGKTFNYEVVIADREGRTVKTIDGGTQTIAPGETKTLSASAPISRLNFWSWGYGYLYDVYTTLKVDGRAIDVVRTRTGFRKTEFANGLVKLNDRAIQVKGYAQRTTNEWPAMGVSVPPWVSDLSNRLIVDGNGNLVRWMHVTPWKQDVESCDRVGLMEAMPAGDSERDVEGRRWEQRVELMRDAIIYNRNNPSIVFYECGNKGISEAHMQQMKVLRDTFDPHGGRAIGAREMLDSKVAEYGGEMLYINKSAARPLWAMEYSRDEGLRKYWDEFSPPYHQNGAGPLYQGQDASAYNRNQDSHAIEDVLRWYDYWRERPGTGRRVSSGGVNIIFSDSNTHFRGAENYRRSGEVDAMRLPKDGYFAHQVMWDGWIDVEQPRVHIIGHWNYEPGTKKDVNVVSSAERVELFINGVSRGFGVASSRFLYTFKNIVWQPGTVKAVGYDAGGKKTCVTEMKTAGTPTAIRLTPHLGPNGLRADGADLMLVDVEVVDADGNRCPTAMNLVNFTISGPADWRGGIAQGPDNYILSKSLPVECGINRVMIRATSKSGRVILQAASADLKPAVTEVVSQPVQVIDGLSREMPDAGLAANLTRGPTPAVTALGLSRSPLHISLATAGANTETASLSFDDNEVTSWSSDGQLASAWINYQFDRPTTIDEVVLKPGSWRTRSYPLRISIDEQVVFNGNTAPSLGYVTIEFTPARGRQVKIELTGAPKEVDSLGNIVGINGNHDVDAGRNSNSALSVVEVEIYGPVMKAGVNHPSRP
jgi:beta-galactosidase